MARDTVESLTYSVREAAAAIGLGRGLTYNLIQSGKLRVVRFGRKVRVPKVEVEAFLEREMNNNGKR